MDDSDCDCELGEEIGCGRFSKVFRAVRKSDGHIVCVKRLHLSRSGVVLSEIQREIANWRTLDHPHIVKYLDSRETPEYVDILMEFVDSPKSLDATEQQIPV
jgi:serine/threonine protein kinase